ncbi:MAG: HD-GYP domain-containing protein, partial [Armatimonadota bacterium]
MQGPENPSVASDTSTPALPTAGALLATLSQAFDRAEGVSAGHNLRACRFALAMGGQLGLPGPLLEELRAAMLLKDSGCTANASRVWRLFGGDDREVKRRSKLEEWNRIAGGLRFVLRNTDGGMRPADRFRSVAALIATPGAVVADIVRLRCQRGGEIARGIGLGPRVAAAIQAAEERWNGTGAPGQLAGEDIPYLARFIQIAQAVEIVATESGFDHAASFLASKSGVWFDPSLVKVAHRVLADRAFRAQWSLPVVDAVASIDAAVDARPMTDTEFDVLLAVFGDIVDAKCGFLEGHSRRVGETARRIGVRMGLSEDIQRLLLRAGFVHDLGAIGLPIRLLEKPSALDSEEREQIRMHPEWTAEALSGLPDLEALRQVAAAHHLRVDGAGYGPTPCTPEMDLCGRILAVAEVCDAVLGDRPHRARRPPDG